MKNSQSLYEHVPHGHEPKHPAHLYKQERQAHMARSRYHAFNEHLAVWITEHTGTMECAYLFFGIGMGSLIGYFTGSIILAAVFGAVSSYLLQLVLLPVIQLGQQVQGRKQELAIDQAHHNTVRILHEQNQHCLHLDAQDAELLKQTQILEAQNSMLFRLVSLLVPSTETPLPQTERRRSHAQHSFYDARDSDTNSESPESPQDQDAESQQGA